MIMFHLFKLVPVWQNFLLSSVRGGGELTLKIFTNLYMIFYARFISIQFILLKLIMVDYLEINIVKRIKEWHSACTVTIKNMEGCLL